MRFLSNFGCKIIFMCSVNFWHQQDSSSLKEALVTWSLCASDLFNWYSVGACNSVHLIFCRIRSFQGELDFGSVYLLLFIEHSPDIATYHPPGFSFFILHHSRSQRLRSPWPADWIFPKKEAVSLVHKLGNSRNLNLRPPPMVSPRNVVRRASAHSGWCVATHNWVVHLIGCTAG